MGKLSTLTQSVIQTYPGTQPVPGWKRCILSLRGPVQVPRAGWEATPLVAKAVPPIRDNLATDVGEVVPSRQLLTLECFQEVAQSPPLTENQLLGIAGNLCCCLTQVGSPAHHDSLCPGSNRA
jgi:hypothetical protein